VRRRRGSAALLLAAGVAFGGCGDSTPPASTTGSAAATTAAAGAGSAEKGRQVWLGQCIACHNSDPAKDGPIGPAVKGASKELLEARVLRAEYPPGYAPKRPSKVMPARPDLAAAVPDLAAYLR
jgi:mono/diheme cytochrome c family protein